MNAIARTGRAARAGVDLTAGVMITLVLGSFLARMSGREGAGISPERASPENGSALSLLDGKGRAAESPAEIPARGWRDILRRTFKEMSEDRVMAVAAGVAYYALLAVIPALTAFISLYGLIADRATAAAHVASLAGALPAGALSVLSEQAQRIVSTDQGGLGFALFLGLGATLWSANSGAKAVLEALNIAYGEREKRSFVALNAVSMAFTFGTLAFLVGLVLALGALPAVLDRLYLSSMTDALLLWGRWPLMFMVLAVFLSLLYRYGPSRENAKWRWITPGSLTAAAGVMGFSAAFSWYASNFSDYNATYGSLGAAVALLTWLWLSSVIVLMGAELNAEIERQTARDTTDGAPLPMGLRGAFAADTVAP